jgi:hypothetical protein
VLYVVNVNLLDDYGTCICYMMIIYVLVICTCFARNLIIDMHGTEFVKNN